MSRPAAALDVRLGVLGASVVDRVVAAVAARAELPIDRISDAQLAAGAICAGAAEEHRRLPLELRHSPDGLAMSVGPLRRGQAGALLDAARVPGIERVVETLADTHAVEGDGEGERLVLRFDRAGGGRD
jgi:serine/threonine-protein kinase RsbW